MIRDADLEEVYKHAASVDADGVRLLVDKLQRYRDSVRDMSAFVDGQAEQSQHTTSVYRLKDHIAAINTRLSEVQFQLDLDHIAVDDLEGCRTEGGYRA